jgi:hypothetical protein
MSARASSLPSSVPDRALSRLGSGLEPLRRGFKVSLGVLPDDIRERLEAEGLEGAPLIDFSYPPAPRCRPVYRSHPLVAVLAETLLERTLGRDAGDISDLGALGRVGCWVSGGVAERTVLALLRVRHQLHLGRGTAVTTLLVEEARRVRRRSAERGGHCRRFRRQGTRGSHDERCNSLACSHRSLDFQRVMRRISVSRGCEARR